MPGLLDGILSDDDEDRRQQGPFYWPGLGFVMPVLGFADPRFEPAPVTIGRELEADEYVWPASGSVH
jgi:hypothetical protein